MTDRELLELAAKAAGIDLHVEWTDEGPTGHYRIGCDGDTWNPLTDDGDALRLAVKLQIDIEHDSWRVWAQDPVSYAQATETFGIGDDRCAATRRAIVRTAAAVAGNQP